MTASEKNDTTTSTIRIKANRGFFPPITTKTTVQFRFTVNYTIGSGTRSGPASEFLFDLPVEEPLNRARRVGVVTLIGAITNERQWRMSIREVLNAERECHIV
jgi:hypothetical protein